MIRTLQSRLEVGQQELQARRRLVSRSRMNSLLGICHHHSGNDRVILTPPSRTTWDGEIKRIITAEFRPLVPTAAEGKRRACPLQCIHDEAVLGRNGASVDSELISLGQPYLAAPRM